MPTAIDGGGMALKRQADSTFLHTAALRWHRWPGKYLGVPIERTASSLSAYSRCSSRGTGDDARARGDLGANAPDEFLRGCRFLSHTSLSMRGCWAILAKHIRRPLPIFGFNHLNQLPPSSHRRACGQFPADPPHSIPLILLRPASRNLMQFNCPQIYFSYSPNHFQILTPFCLLIPKRPWP
jgi:hypothetical protein